MQSKDDEHYQNGEKTKRRSGKLAGCGTGISVILGLLKVFGPERIPENLSTAINNVSWFWVILVGSASILLWNFWAIAEVIFGLWKWLVCLKVDVKTAELIAQNRQLEVMRINLGLQQEVDSLIENAAMRASERGIGTDRTFKVSDTRQAVLQNRCTEASKTDPDTKPGCWNEQALCDSGWLAANQEKAKTEAPRYSSQIQVAPKLLRLTASDLCMRAREYGVEIPESVMELLVKNPHLIPKPDILEALCHAVFAPPCFFKKSGYRFNAEWARKRLQYYHTKGIAKVHLLEELLDQSNPQANDKLRIHITRIEKNLLQALNRSEQGRHS